MAYELLDTQIRELIDVLQVAERTFLNEAVGTGSYIKQKSLRAFAARIRKQVPMLQDLLLQEQKPTETLVNRYNGKSKKDYAFENGASLHASASTTQSSPVDLTEIRSKLDGASDILLLVASTLTDIEWELRQIDTVTKGNNQSDYLGCTRQRDHKCLGTNCCTVCFP